MEAAANSLVFVRVCVESTLLMSRSIRDSLIFSLAKIKLNSNERSHRPVSQSGATRLLKSKRRQTTTKGIALLVAKRFFNKLLTTAKSKFNPKQARSSGSSLLSDSEIQNIWRDLKIQMFIKHCRRFKGGSYDFVKFPDLRCCQNPIGFKKTKSTSLLDKPVWATKVWNAFSVYRFVWGL